MLPTVQAGQLTHSKRAATCRQEQQPDAPASPPEKRARFHQNQLTQLPNECLNHIFSFCSARDLCSLRQTCRHFNSCIHPSTWRAVFISLACSHLQQCDGLRHIFYRPEYLSMARSALAEIDTIKPAPRQISEECLIGFSLCSRAAIRSQIWRSIIFKADTKDWPAEAFAMALTALARVPPGLQYNGDAIKYLGTSMYDANKQRWSVAGVIQLATVLASYDKIRRHSAHLNLVLNTLYGAITREDKQAWHLEELNALQAALSKAPENMHSLSACESVRQELASRTHQT